MREHSEWITTQDGERLAATLYLPDDAAGSRGTIAALMEALPYRKDDITASYRDTYERFVDSGFAVLRLDLRGTGSSTGIMTDEYPEIERSDLRTAIEWLAGQPWSNGRVGMFGTSYSGFNALQMAIADVPELGAIAATYATDDRYTDDVHYCGGVLRAIDLIDYVLYMVSMNALPPVPAEFGEGWRAEWTRRIDETPPWLLEWFAHPTDSPTWRRGSVRLGPDGMGYERMTCPTMIIAGWADGYRNNTFRVIEQYERNGLPWRLLAGPWVHTSPDSARPGPNVDDDQLVLAFFDQHLRGGPPIDRPPGQVFVRQPVEPAVDLDEHPGVWRDIATWPPTGFEVRRLTTDDAAIRTLKVHGDVGWTAWNSCGGRLPWGQPLDQAADNGRSSCFDWSVDGLGLTDIEVLGNASVRLRVRSDQRYGHVGVKLCDVAPDGTSTLITRGMLDLTHRGCWPADEGGTVNATPTPLEPDTWIDVTVGLEATTWTLTDGHRLRLAIAGTDWPNCWPPPGPVTLGIDPAGLELLLPTVADLPESATLPPGSSPSPEERDGVVWRIEHDVMADETRAITRYGGTYSGSHDARITDDYRGEIGVSTTNPGNAWARGTSTFEIEWPGTVARTEATLSVTSTETDFHVEVTLAVSENGVSIADRTWTERFAR